MQSVKTATLLLSYRRMILIAVYTHLLCKHDHETLCEWSSAVDWHSLVSWFCLVLDNGSQVWWRWVGLVLVTLICSIVMRYWRWVLGGHTGGSTSSSLLVSYFHSTHRHRPRSRTDKATSHESCLYRCMVVRTDAGRGIRRWWWEYQKLESGIVEDCITRSIRQEFITHVMILVPGKETVTRSIQFSYPTLMGSFSFQ